MNVNDAPETDEVPDKSAIHEFVFVHFSVLLADVDPAETLPFVLIYTFQPVTFRVAVLDIVDTFFDAFEDVAQEHARE